VANLLLTRAVARQQEMSVRTALGAGRGRLLRQLLLESLMLSAAGGVAGIALAYWSLRALLAGATDIPRAESIGLDGSVILFAFLATIVTAALFGLAPALHVVGRNIGASLKTRETGSGQRQANRLRGTLIVTQFALSLVLLVGAGLLIRSFANRLAVGVGFDTEQLLTAEINLPGSRYESEAQIQFFEDLVPLIQSIPGVRSASAITFAPLAGAGSATSFWRADQPAPPPDQEPVADLRWVHRD
jgi:predicted lysophospholipase L1 biosynthesis ABC-type transport system permease subunit